MDSLTVKKSAVSTEDDDCRALGNDAHNVDGVASPVGEVDTCAVPGNFESLMQDLEDLGENFDQRFLPGDSTPDTPLVPLYTGSTSEKTDAEASRQRSENIQALLKLYAQRKQEVESLRLEVIGCVQKASEMQTTLDDTLVDLERARKETDAAKRSKRAAESRYANLVGRMRQLVGTKRKRGSVSVEDDRINLLLQELDAKRPN